MCGRYTLIRLADFTHIFPWIDVPDNEVLTPRDNVALSTTCPLVSANREGESVLSLARWGLIPYWTKGKPKVAPINAKSETATTLAMFKFAMERRRSLVPANGFYVWHEANPEAAVLHPTQARKASCGVVLLHSDFAASCL